ncbi:MAG: hypothetical protein Q9180_003920 [Flavoplaca navasiana]
MPAASLVAVALKHLANGQVRSLNISGLRQLSEGDVQRICAPAFNLETIYILDMPQLSLDFISYIRTQNPLCNRIYHTELFSCAFSRKPKYLALVSVSESNPVNNTRIPITNVLLARILTGEWLGKPNLRKADGVQVDWQRAELQYSPLLQDKMTFPVFPIHDTLLSTTKLINGLIAFLNCAFRNRRSYISTSPVHTGFALANTFASASPNIGGESTEMEPLPAFLFNTCIIAERTTLWPIPFPDLKMGDYAIFIIHEHDPFTPKPNHSEEALEDTFRMAVVGPKSENKQDGFDVQSMETYIAGARRTSYEGENEDIGGLIQHWKEQMTL